MAKFKVGDRVRAIKGLETGEVGVVKRRITDEMCRVAFDNGLTFSKYNQTLELVEETAPASEILTRITVIESELAALKAMAQAAEPAPTGNAARKAVIEKARAFVEKYSGIVPFRSTPLTKSAGDIRTEFVVNEEKRTVVALGHFAHIKGTRAKAFARCAPGDVFNADIGKAIAVGRLYGIEVPAEFFDAPKPDEVVVGMRVKYVGRVERRVGEIATVNPPGRYKEKDDKCAIDSHFAEFSEIIDDTEAQY